MLFAQPEEDEMLVPHQELVAADAAQPMEGAMLIALYGGSLCCFALLPCDLYSVVL